MVISILQIIESYWKYCSSVEVSDEKKFKAKEMLLLGYSL